VLNLISRFFNLLDERGRRQAFGLLLLMLAISVLEMVSIGMIVPLLQTLVGQTNSVGLAWVRRLVPDSTPEQALLLITGAFAGVTLAKNAAVLAVIHAVNRFMALNAAGFQQRLYHRYLAQSLLFHTTRNSAELLRNLTISVSICFDGIRIVLTIILDLALIAGTCALLFWLQPVATIIAAITLILLAVIYHRIAAPRLRRWGARSHEVEADILKQARQALENIKLIKLTNKAEFFEASFRALSNTRARLLSYTLTSLNVPRTLVESVLIVGFFAGLFILLGSNYALVDLFPVIGLFGMVALRLMPSMNRLMSGLADVRQRSAPLDELTREMMTMPAPQPAGVEPDRSPLFRSTIELSDVTVSYGDGRRNALENVNLTIRRGETVGLVGPSGSGKSTLADVIMGLTAPVSGIAYVDGVDIAELRSTWSQCIGYVPQEIFLLDDTVRRNIAFGVSDDRIDERRLARAIAFACLEEVIASLPEGLNTTVGEHGRRLSGGQRQRIGIARALYQDPAIVVFDEATSSLDGESEAAIVEATRSIAAEKTVIIIAHRLSTVRPCGRLVFMMDGRINGEGSFDQLVATNPGFARMARLGQFHFQEPAYTDGKPQS